MEEDEERGTLGKRSKERIISAEKKKKLMKKLARIRLNKSREYASIVDMAALYEAKIRKLKLNNNSLAKAHSEQKQVAQTWYETVLSLKRELHDSQESLLHLHCQLKGNGENEHYIQESTQRRIRAIVEPLDAAVSDALRDAFSLTGNLTKVKQLVSSVVAFSNKEKLNFSRRSSHGSLGSRPPLSQNSKSPRKNVVHPMVEGHVLQPATIPIPRMTLQDRRRYRLQEPVVGRMEDIGELSTSSESESTSSDVDESTSDQIIEDENVVCHMKVEDVMNEETAAVSIKSESHDEESLVNGDSPIPILIPEDSALDEDKTISMDKNFSPEKNQLASVLESPCELKLETESSRESFKENTSRSPLNKEKGDHVCDEDPLEGSSWMHLAKGRSKNTKKRKTKSGKANIRTSGLHFLPDSSSESEEEYMEIPLGKVKHGKVKGSAKNRPSRSKSSKVSISHLDLLSSKVSRRSKKSDNYSLSSTKDSKDTDELNNQIEEPRSSALPSFILNDSQSDSTLLNENSDQKKSPAGKELENVPILGNKQQTSASPNSGLNLEPVANLTCVMNSSMDITECLSKEVLQSLRFCTVQSAVETEDICSSLPKEKDISVTETDDTQISSNDIVSGSTSRKLDSHKTSSVQEEKVDSHKTSSVQDSKKPNKYFKAQENETNEVVSKQQAEQCIYDISLMDVSQITCLTNVGKENIPPNINVSSEDLAMKIKDISIVVKDIMKTPPSSDMDPNAPFYGFPNTSNNQNHKITLDKSNRTATEKSKCKGKRKGNSSSLRKTPKKAKRTKFTENCGISILSSPSLTGDDDVWSPPKKSTKRKTKVSKKDISSGKKLKANADESTEKRSAVDENCEAIPMTMTNDINGKNGDIIENQIVHPLFEIPVDPNSLGPISKDIFQDVNDIIRNHIKKDVITCDTYEVIDLDSDNEEEDPLAIKETELINGRPRRATLKIQSFKEPALNTKMRRTSFGGKPKRVAKKKSVKA